MGQWAHVGTTALAAFLASLVEFVEALTIVLAVGTVRGWRSAITGMVAGLGLLTLLVVLFGAQLRAVPLETLQLVIGVLLLLFGLRWLRKAVLRAAGVIAVHDEAAIYREEIELLAHEPARGERSDRVGVITSFKAVVLEGLEVVFIVIATGGAGGAWWPASLGAAAAGLLVLALGLVLHRPLARVPENTLKFSVGVLLSAFGVFWTGEGLHLTWPWHDLALIPLTFAFLAAALAAVPLARQASVVRGAA